MNEIYPGTTGVVEQPEDTLARAEMKTLVIQAISMSVRLTPRELLIVKKLFGVDGYEEQTVDEVAGELGICTATVRRARNSAIEKLRAEAFGHEFRRGRPVSHPIRPRLLMQAKSLLDS